MLRRHLTLAVCVVVAIGAALWLVWLAGGRAPNDYGGTRLDTATGAAGDTTRHAGIVGMDSSIDAVPYEDVVTNVPPADTVKADAPLAKPTDPEVATAPLVDTTIAAVESDLDDRELTIPVQGVRPDQLVDTYTASRSEGRTHHAIDIIAPGGTPVLAVTTGRVLKLFQSDKGGITLYQLDPDGRTVYYYAHLAGYAPNIAEGQTLTRGQLLGYVGDTGNAGPGNTHLHFEITIVESPQRFWSGTPVNPYPILARKR
jgi:peptidoglycan LD-endopeptidase LytH